MFKGRTHAALDLLANNGKGGVLCLDYPANPSDSNLPSVRKVHNVAKCLCSSYINPTTVSPLLACRLIALDKCPGVTPIGIGDMARHIIAKSVLVVYVETSRMRLALSSFALVRFRAVKRLSIL